MRGIQGTARVGRRARSQDFGDAGGAGFARRRGAHADPDSTLVGQLPRLLLAWAFLVQVLAVRALAGGLLVPESSLSLSPCRIDLNRASVFELQVLPSVGPSRAEALILERVRRGPFRGLADLQRIHGFGPKTVAGLANFVVF